MKNILLLFYITFCLLPSSYGQGGTWTWISGDSALNSPGVYGTRGVPSVNNYPPGEYEAVDFKDHQGNFWIYGGTYPSMSDLWKFNPVTLEWTWVKGDGYAGDPPVFGTIGVSSPSNTPGTRTYCAATWVDTSGMFWLFGGWGCSNDLWRYDINTNEWTWMQGGGGAVVYGTQGIPSPSNTPGSSSEECSAWTDSLNNLWLFGSESSNDLWRFDISTLEWTWMKGSTYNTPANYGVKGVADSSNDPGYRYSYTKWKDLKGNFWLMGGEINYFDDLNDVWKYDLNINEWTWMSGTNVFDDPGSYQSNCIFSAVNWPSSRFEQRSSVTDNCGRFWLFGGLRGISGMFNDLWVFDPQQLEWNWLSGTNVPVNGNYGSLGVPAPSNTPPSRFGADAWWGNDNKFYMFGGLQNDHNSNCYSDVWVFNPDTNCVAVCGAVAVLPPIANFQASKTVVCANDCINFTDLSSNATSWQWLFAGAIDSTSASQNPQGICYSKAGIYNVLLIASNSGGSDTLTLTNYITVNPAPPTPTITQLHDTLFCSFDSSYKSYQWYFDSLLIPSATNSYLPITNNGNYNVKITNSDSCSIAVGINILGIEQFTVYSLRFTVSPDPVSDELLISGNNKVVSGKITIFNIVGETIYTKEMNSKQETVNCKPFPAGIYFVQVANENGRWVGRFVKE